MQTEDQKTEARCTDWIRYPHLGMAAYRIWQITNGVLWLQAHEWQLIPHERMVPRRGRLCPECSACR